MLKVEKLCKNFGEKAVLTDFSACFDSGIHAICGESGAGKTTFLRIIAGLEKPDSGSVSGCGKVSMAFQEPRLLPWYTAERNVEIVSDEKSAKSFLSLLGLENEYCTFPSELSGGMQKRVSLARALAAEYDTLLLDEPFSGLDESNEKKALEIIRRHSDGKHVLVVTHNLLLAESLDSVTYIS